MTTGFGMGFGNTNPAPAFGAASANPIFGAAATNPAPAFGAATATAAPAFGAASTNTAPAFGTGANTFGFGAAQPAASTGFTFGQATTTASTGFSFGQPASTVAPTTGFSFGQPASTAAPTAGFSFGQPTNTVASNVGFSFGNPAVTTAPAFSFGGIGQPTGFTGFGGGTTLGTNLGQTTGFGTGGFGTGAFGTNTAIGTNPAVGAVPVIDNCLANIAAAVTCPLVYGDERDSIIAKWNQLQAFWGTGKGYYASTVPPVEFTPENPFCRFKTVGYSCVPLAKPEDGLVSLIFNKKEEEVKAQQQQIIDSLQRIFGNKPNISFCVESVRTFPEQKTEVVIYLVERLPAGTTHRIVPTEICAYIEQPSVKPQLVPLGIINVYAKTGLSKDLKTQYLDNPPAGIDPFLWQQAKLDNPNPEKLIPVPLIGFKDLHGRMKCQEYEAMQHQERLDIIADDISELNRRHTNTVAKITENKRKLIEFQHRVLKTLVQQEVARKTGYSIQAEEEQLRAKLEAIQAELSAPTQFKGHLKELISQIRMQNYQGSSGGEGERYTMDEIAKHKIKEHLRLQQEGIGHLVAIIKEDLMDLKTIEDVSKESSEKR